MTCNRIHLGVWLAACGLWAGAPSALVQPAAAQDATEEFGWPRYQTQRFKEDYTTLHTLDEVPVRDWFDRIKYLPLNEQGDIWLSFGGQARWRYEGVRNFLFDPDENDNFNFLQRYFLWGSLNLGPDLRIFAEGKSAWVHDRDLPGGRRTVDHDELDLQNAFVEWRRPGDEGLGLLIRGGRQELLYGRQRLVSPLDWSNTRRTWDGVVTQVSGEGWTLDAFAAWFAPVRKFEFNRTDDDHFFWGLYSTINRLGGSAHNLDAYLLSQHLDPTPTVSSDRYTIGGRLWGPLFSGATPGGADVRLRGAQFLRDSETAQSERNEQAEDAALTIDFTYDLEGAYQFGKTGGRAIDAFFISSEVGATLREVEWKPYLAVGFDYASGDRDPTDGRARTFNQLYPLGHAYLGYADVVGRQNIIDLRFTGRVNPTPKLWLQADLHNFWLAQRRDALYGVGGAVVRSGAAGASRSVGTEIDFTAGYSFDHHWSLLLGYSRFFKGDFIDDTGGGRDIDYWYAQLTFTF